MSSQMEKKKPTIKWGKLRDYLKKKGFTIHTVGSSHIIVSSKTSAGLRQAVVISDKCSRTANSEVIRPYLKQIERVFGVTTDDLLKS